MPKKIDNETLYYTTTGNKKVLISNMSNTLLMKELKSLETAGKTRSKDYYKLKFHAVGRNLI